MIKMKNILFLAFYYNHSNDISSKRMQGIAKYLPKYGYKTIVVVPKTLNETVKIKNVEVIETEYTDMISRFLPSSKGVETKSEFSGNTSQNNFLSKIISYAGEIFAYPDGMKYWYKPAVKVSREIINENDISGIISSSFPITAHKIAYTLKQEFDIPWIADLRDLWNLNPYLNHTAIRTYFEKKLEMKLFDKADALTTTTNVAGETLRKLHPTKRIKPIYSGYDVDEYKHLKQMEKSNKLTFMYAGSLYNGKRDPTIIFKALNELTNENKIDLDKIAFNFYGDQGNINELAEKYNVQNAINVKGKISHEEILQKQMNSDVLLIISWMHKNEKMFIPGKAYEYMASKKPILSLGVNEGSLKELIETTNIGYHVSDVKNAKKAIYTYYSKYYNNELKYNGNELTKKYTFENTAKNYAELLNEIQ